MSQITVARERALILDAIVAEREAQDKKWGGPEHDDAHTRADWFTYICNHLVRAKTEGEAVGRGGHYRKALIRVAALCVAAIESNDRKFFANLVSGK